MWIHSKFLIYLGGKNRKGKEIEKQLEWRLEECHMEDEVRLERA
jgi:hypothetical protein